MPHPIDLPITAWRLVQEAVKAVPAVRYALGIGGIAALVAIVGGLGIDYRIAVFGTITILGLSFVLVLFARMTEIAGANFYIPIMVATWSFLILTIASGIGMTTSFFFQWPLDFSGNGGNTGRHMVANSKGPLFENPQLDDRRIDGCIRSQQFPEIAGMQCIEPAQRTIANAFCKEAGYRTAVSFTASASGHFEYAWKYNDPGNGQRPNWDADNTGNFDFTQINCAR